MARRKKAAKPAVLGREAILAAEDLPQRSVEVPEWGGRVLLRTLSGAERDDFELVVLRTKGVNVRAQLVALCAVDDAGARLFGDGDAAALGQKSGRALDRVFAAARRLNGLEERDVAELEKNSAADPGGASSSSSPGSSA